jgi:hypothetical protein
MSPVKLNSLHAHFHIHEQAPPSPPRTSSVGLPLALAPRGRRPLLLLVSCSAWASSSLPAGGELPVKDRARVGGTVDLGVGSLAESADPHPRLEGGGGDASPSPTNLFQSCLECAVVTRHGA